MKPVSYTHLQARKQADFDLEQKKIALTEAEVSLRRLQDKYNELKADREMACLLYTSRCV